MRRSALCAALAGIAACAPPPSSAPRPGPVAPAPAPGETAPRPSPAPLPPVPPVRGALRLDVVYPSEGAALTTRGSNFIFGSTGSGSADLTINGQPVQVAPNGAFLGFLPVPRDGVYRLEATLGAERTALMRRVQLPPATPVAALDTASIQPRGAVTLGQGETLQVRFRGAPGGSARLILPDGQVHPMLQATAPVRSTGFAQDRDPAGMATEYVAEIGGTAAFAAPGSGPTLVTAPGGAARIEVTAGGRVSSALLPLSVARLGGNGYRMATVATDRPDGAILAAAVPGGGAPTAWPLLNGTRVRITGERQGAYRVQLTPSLSVWADSRAFTLDDPEAVAPEGSVDAVRVIPTPAGADVRLGTSGRLPFAISMDGNSLVVDVYGARSRTNWLYYGAETPLVRRAAWTQPEEDVYRLRIDLAEPAWGWRAAWDPQGALVLHIRRAPRIDRARPLQGIHVAVDAGHPPLGATGPTRLREADANLAVSRRLAALLRAAGARVTEIRPDTAGVALGLRPVLAERAGADLFVSVHNNAFPDGVDPFANNGTTVFYNAPQSLDLARGVHRELVRELGLRDLGIALSDLAVLRPTWMPSVLTETMFMMIPEQEAALRDPAVQERIAAAHLLGIERFLLEFVAPLP